MLALPLWPPLPLLELLDEAPPTPDEALPDELVSPHPRHGSKPPPSARHVCAPIAPPTQAQAICCPGTQRGFPPLVAAALVLALVVPPPSTPPPQLAVTTTRAPTAIQALLIRRAYSMVTLRGSFTMKIVPSASVDCTSTVPWCASTICFTM